MRRALVALAVAACAGGGFPDQADRQAYLDLIGRREPTADDLTACAELADPDLAGDCGLSVAIRLGNREGDPRRRCREVRAGLWRSECFFVAAEELRRRHDVRGALEACASSGPFRSRCEYHLWQEDLFRIPGHLPVAIGVERAHEVVARWEPRLADHWRGREDDLPLGAAPPDDTIPGAMFTRFFQLRAEPSARVDITPCDALQAERAWCEAGVLDVIRRRALDWERRGGSCEGLPDDVAAATSWWEARGVVFVEDPRVTAALGPVCAGSP